jgi:Mn2+/Fe2+ NRAMP family transporter
MKLLRIIRTLGPGLLYAGAAVGVSHLVQSTRAGASYGFELIWVLIAANIIKYPFFEFAPRYATSTGKSLIYGYNSLGKWALILYILLTVSTMFAITAAILMVTSGLFAQLFGLNISYQLLLAMLMVGISVFLFVGKFKTLEGMMKYIILILSLSTLIAVILAFKPELPIVDPFNWSNVIDMAFLIAFVGWMPAPFDVTVWYSTWTVAKQSNTSTKITMKSAIRDFNIGYIGTALLAAGFLSLGALVMYGSGKAFSSGGVAFAGQLIDMYVNSLGNWAFYIIGIAAFTSMLSTSITVMDAYPRVLNPSFRLLRNINEKEKKSEEKSYILWMVFLIVGTLILILWFSKSMKFMVDMATTISFVTAPVIAALNLAVVLKLPKMNRPNVFLRGFSWISLILLIFFSLYFLIWKFA